VRRTTTLATFGLMVLFAAGAVPARAGGLDLRAGGFFPRGDANLFDDTFELFGVDGKDFKGFTAGIEYNTAVSEFLEVGVSLDGFERSVDTSYLDFIHPDGGEIRQTLRYTVVPLGLTLRLIPTGRRVAVAPYLAVGADLFYWQWREEGEFIDFIDPDNPIVEDSFRSDGWSGGFHVAGGVRFRVTPDFSITGEGRYQRAKATMGDDFSSENEIDLSGWSATVGVHIRF
jgi:opacity protein-like surface antigen